MQLRPSPLMLALAVAFAPALGHAQSTDSTDTKASSADSLKLDQVLVTGSSTKTTRMKQSLSVSTLDSEQISRSGATSAAELLRSIPGVRSESSGGEGNANITLRGVPLSAGGSRYVQLQEDGLPILLFGDIAFGTADQFLRADASVQRLEVVRGGSASTMASNSPGGVVNFISRTGQEPGGSVALSAGLDKRLWRADLAYGGKLGTGTSFFIGGFGRSGEGGRPTGLTLESGGQIKANLTQKFNGGYVRVSLKALDDTTPSFMPVPVRVSQGQIQTLPGVDPRSAFFIKNNFGSDPFFARDGSTQATNPRDGLHVRSTAIGLEGAYQINDSLSIEDRLRKASNSGRFMALFPADNGKNGSQSYFTGTLFNTSLDSLDNLFNDLKLTQRLKLGDGQAQLVGGLFYGKQTVAQTWFWNQYNLSFANGQLLDAAGQASQAPIARGWTTWGGCCTRSFDVDYTQTSPYAAATWESGPLNLDLSVRRDHQSASGATLSGDNTAQKWDPASRKVVDYSVSHTSYSVGVNYALNKNLALFGRHSNGVAFSADRLLYGNPLDGSVPIAVNEIDQTELGLKWRDAKGLSLFGTLFAARTRESNYEVTSRQFTANSYRAQGLELEAAYAAGPWRLAGGATLTHARISAANDATLVDKQPRRQAKFTWQLSPSYSWGDVELGLGLIGSGKSYGDDANTITMKGYTVVNAFANYQINDKTQLSISANNAFNALAYTEIEGDGHAARALNGRTLRLGLKYEF
ncbi:TonB-dependent siderophore receptor [Roseateles sp. BYS180W]|uniref:TonB-dependent siderophore receptor n=1 Tax=Roseateles rivi TaxID=3299028 RepID=A0ABW7FVG6_9BURK